MKILAFESSAKTASVCLAEDGVMRGLSYTDAGLTHSVTLLPMAEDLLKNCGVEQSALDLLAVAAGPGSFTGLRIGISVTKGLAWGLEIPCAKVSTLEAMAENLVFEKGLICPVMDARRGEVYNALFLSDGEKLTRIAEDRAISAENLGRELLLHGERQILVGDGAHLCYNLLAAGNPSLVLPPPNLLYQNAWGVAVCARRLAGEGRLVSGETLVPEYLRLSQAERERNEKQKKEREV